MRITFEYQSSFKKKNNVKTRIPAASFLVIELNPAIYIRSTQYSVHINTLSPFRVLNVPIWANKIKASHLMFSVAVFRFPVLKIFYNDENIIIHVLIWLKKEINIHK